MEYDYDIQDEYISSTILDMCLHHKTLNDMSFFMNIPIRVIRNIRLQCLYESLIMRPITNAIDLCDQYHCPIDEFKQYHQYREETGCFRNDLEWTLKEELKLLKMKFEQLLTNTQISKILAREEAIIGQKFADLVSKHISKSSSKPIIQPQELQKNQDYRYDNPQKHHTNDHDKYEDYDENKDSDESDEDYEDYDEDEDSDDYDEDD